MLTGLMTVSNAFNRHRSLIHLVIVLSLILLALIVPGTIVLAGDGLGGSVCNGC